MENQLSRKQIAFDLKVKKLRNYFNPYTKAYYEIEDFFNDENFIHRQGSVYCSKYELTYADIIIIIHRLLIICPWVAECTTQMDFTIIGDLHSMNEYLK